MRKNQRIVSTLSNDEDDNARLHKQSLSNFCSEDESDSSKELELNAVNSSSKSKGGAALNINGKKRASRGSATDPQSLYARVTSKTRIQFFNGYQCTVDLLIFFPYCREEGKE